MEITISDHALDVFRVSLEKDDLLKAISDYVTKGMAEALPSLAGYKGHLYIEELGKPGGEVIVTLSKRLS